MNKPHNLFPICTSLICAHTRNARGGEAMRNSIRCSQRMHWVLAMLTVIAGTLAMPTIASTVFTDNTFNLADYTIETFQTGGATINTTQTLSDGNPDAALRTIINEPVFSSVFFTSQYFMNTSFIYDPGTQGAIQSIDASGDAFLSVQNLTLTDRFAIAILSQGNNYYVHSISTPPVNAVWQSSSLSGLQASDFNLVTDLLTITTDSTSHPDFTSGIIQFGTVIGTFNTGTTQPIWDIRVDNLSYTVNAVPVPPAIWLFGSGLLGLMGISRCKKAA